MAFTIKDYHDLTKVLREHPEWREELRHLLLSEELLTLPEAIRQLTLAQQQAEERLSRLETIVERLVEGQERLTEQVSVLTERQQHIEERLSRLETIVERLAQGQERLTEQVSALAEGQKRLIERVDTLTEGQERLTERVDTLAEGQKRLTERVDTLAEGQKRLAEGQEELKDRVGGLENRVGGLEDSVGELKDRVGGLEDRVGKVRGDTLEITYRNRAFAYFGTVLHRVRVKELHTLENKLRAALTSDEYRELLPLDLLVTGKLPDIPESPDILLAVEISSVVDITDVSRAAHRASLLRKAGYHAVPVVAGEDVTQGATEAVQEQNVVLLLDGQVTLWKEAVANWEDIQLAEN